ncbi:MAG: glycoside hydrolase family 3 protein [Clostridia bacterium]|nr:glycoside hydrolase family 3 protein [Clostridia bacterium]
MVPVYLDETKPDEERALDLLSRMTLDEKVSQIKFDSDAIDRLGIPAYNWWNEALHGVARAGAATVFPQPIALAAAFDDALLHKIGTAVSTEGRAKYNEQRRLNDAGLYKGITYWSPNINLFRDPRWGRGHETYGEDPYLTGRMGTGYIKGLQGNSKRLRAAACIKHFAAHSGPEKGRHSFNSVVSKKDLAESYYPAFKKCIQQARVEGVMGGYNCLNGELCCGSDSLINGLIRKEWGFEGYYVSDCGAIKDFHKNHRITSNITESAALAIKSGCDLNCGSVYLNAFKAYEEGLIDESDIDKCVLHLIRTLLRLGMFDKNCEHDSIPYEENDTPQNHSLALKAALEAMVLLKNDGALPLDKKSLKTVAVIGPNADSVPVLLGNYNGTPTEKYTLLDGVRSMLDEETRLYYSEGAHLWRENVEALAEADDRLSEAVAMAVRSDAVILCLGLDPTLEGEEGDANNSYAGADKTDLALPLHQQRLIEAVCETGKKVILVVAAGSALDLRYAEKHCEAILQMWYPGQMGGLAAAKLIFGEVSPSGRLPVTFYESDAQLPPFEDYSMCGRTYKCIDGTPLYPFGYGLSYTSFEYSSMAFQKTQNGGSVWVSVKNTGEMDADEVIQVYVSLKSEVCTAPHFSLVQFERVSLKKGEIKRVELKLSNDAFCVFDDEGNQIDCDRAAIYVGGSQPDERSAELTGINPLCIQI